MDYKEKYENALERARELKNKLEKNCSLATPTGIESIFPELASEDDKIRNEILSVIRQFDNDSFLCGKNYDYKKWIAWLEKQDPKKIEKELEKAYKCADEVQYRNGYEDAKRELEKQGEPQSYRSNADTMRKNLIKAFKTVGTNNWGWCGLYVKDILHFLESKDAIELENRGEQNTAEFDDTNAKRMFIKALERVEEQNAKGYKLTDCDKNSWWEDFKNYTSCTIKQKPIDKIEPKFHVGDWVVHDMSDGRVTPPFQIIEMTNKSYVLDNGECFYFSDAEEIYRNWTIEDAKDGDVLTIGNEYFLFKAKKDNTSPVVYISHCFADSAGAFRVTNGRDCGEFLSIEHGIKACPATQEQRDLLFQKMKEAGYEWDSNKKELRKIDDYCKENCKGFQEIGKCYVDGECKAKREAEQKPAWSDDDEKMMQFILKYVNASASNFDYQNIQIWFRNIKKRVQSHWKPTEKQMNLLGEVQQALLGKDCHNRFVNFMYDLKKL